MIVDVRIQDFPIGSIAPLHGQALEKNLRVQGEISIFATYFSDVRVKQEALRMGFTVEYAELLRREAQGTLTETDAETLKIRREMDKRLWQEHIVE